MTTYQTNTKMVCETKTFRITTTEVGMKIKTTYVSVLPVRSYAYALDEIEQQLAGHRLDRRDQGLVVNILGENVDRFGQHFQGQVLAYVVHQVGKRAVRQGPARTQDNTRENVMRFFSNTLTPKN